jgi:hypothetical protein
MAAQGWVVIMIWSLLYTKSGRYLNELAAQNIQSSFFKPHLPPAVNIYSTNILVMLLHEFKQISQFCIFICETMKVLGQSFRKRLLAH